MNNEQVIPDQVHIDKIRERLWCDREFGRAALMVGAGFSKNAEKVTPGVADFPLWVDLAGAMFDELYHEGDPRIRDREHKRLTDTSGLNAVRLASQYEASFGTYALDSLIRKKIPDKQHRPGRLHLCLLKLPWSDVFTTNYDTLLERTLPTVHERKYDIVLDGSNIPHAMRPRIVKLHGCLYSKRPLIITEEHYRTYPQEFAPFVNMVQQAIMENLLCLVGFSGEDPNFLYWSGWVRDNLGQHAPPIYLVGLENHTPHEDRLLQNRNVIPIDLSPVVAHGNANPGDRHRLAFSWFVENLLQGAPPNPVRWPDVSSPQACISRSILTGLPHVPKSRKHLKPRKGDEWTSPVDKEKLLCTLGTWKTEREEYPNWIVCPRRNRNEIWKDLKGKIGVILQFLHLLGIPEQLEFLFELNWRLERALMPLGGIATNIAQVVKRVNPYPEQCEMEGAEFTPRAEEHKNLDWGRLGSCWVDLIFALARSNREDIDSDKFRDWMGLIETVSEQRLEWKARWCYEECLFHLYCLDENAARKTVSKWPDTIELPLWEERRASILAETGELLEAERVAEDALADVRRRQSLSRGDLFLMSLEGWLMLLLNAIKRNYPDPGSEVTEDYWDRWDKLGTYQCNPWSELEWMDMALNTEVPRSKQGKEVRTGFDPGQRIISYDRASSSDPIQYRQAFSYLRMLEEGGLPTTVGIVNTVGKSITRPALVIEYFSVPRSVSIMVRSRNEEDLGKWLDRVRVAVLGEPELPTVMGMLMASFEQELGSLGRRDSARIRVIVEAISRACFRFPEDTLTQLFELAIAFYNHPIARQDIFLYKSLSVLFERLLYAMPQCHVLDRIEVLLSLPCPGDRHFQVRNPESWVEPLAYLEWSCETLPADFDRSSWNVHLANLLGRIKSGEPEGRKRAVLRLRKITEIHGLTQKEFDDFGTALWSEVEPESQLPIHTGLHHFAILTLPEPLPGKAKHNLRRNILRRDFPRVFRREVTPAGQESISVIRPDLAFESLLSDLRGSTVPLFPRNEEQRERFIDWTPEEAVCVLEKVISWWDDEKDQLGVARRKVFQDFTDILRERLYSLVPVLREIILPRLVGSDEQSRHRALNLVSEMDKAGFCVLSALPMTLFLDGYAAEEVVRRIREGMLSRLYEEASEAVVGILHWAARSSPGTIPAPTTDLWNELEYKLVARKQPALDTAIRCVSAIVEYLPEVLEDGKIELERLFETLDYLLTDTAFPDNSENIQEVEAYLPISLEEIPEYRRSAARLSYAIFRYLQEREMQIPEAIERWQAAAQSDPLPEVRRAWHSLE